MARDKSGLLSEIKLCCFRTVITYFKLINLFKLKFVVTLKNALFNEWKSKIVTKWFNDWRFLSWYDFRRPAEILGENWNRNLYNSVKSKQKSKNYGVQNLSGRTLFQEQVKFLKSGIWFQFYNASNKDTYFLLTWYYLVIWPLLFKQRECDLNQSKDDFLVEWIAKNNSWNNGDRHKIHESFLINSFVFVITLVSNSTQFGNDLN